MQSLGHLSFGFPPRTGISHRQSRANAIGREEQIPGLLPQPGIGSQGKLNIAIIYRSVHVRVTRCRYLLSPEAISTPSWCLRSSPAISCYRPIARGRNYELQCRPIQDKIAVGLIIFRVIDWGCAVWCTLAACAVAAIHSRQPTVMQLS